MTGTEISDERKREIVELYWRLHAQSGEVAALDKIQLDYGLSPGETQKLVRETGPRS